MNLKLTVRSNISDSYWGISHSKTGYQARTNVVNDERGDVVTDCHGILARWRKLFSRLLNVRGVDDVRQTYIHTAEPLGSQPSAFEDEMANEELKRHKLPGTDQIPAKSIKAWGKTIRSAIRNLLILFSISGNCLRTVRSR